MDYRKTAQEIYDHIGKKENIISAKGKVIDLVLPVIFLIASCIICMIYTSGNRRQCEG